MLYPQMLSKNILTGLMQLQCIDENFCIKSMYDIMHYRMDVIRKVKNITSIPSNIYPISTLVICWLGNAIYAIKNM